jgi:hypothetical protein
MLSETMPANQSHAVFCAIYKHELNRISSLKQWWHTETGFCQTRSALYLRAATRWQPSRRQVKMQLRRIQYQQQRRSV